VGSLTALDISDLSYPEAHRVSTRLSFYVSVYIIISKHPTSGLAEENIRPIDCSTRRKACCSITILGAVSISPQTLAHFSQYFTGLHNFTP
jgi:hypothetical protein